MVTCLQVLAALVVTTETHTVSKTGDGSSVTTQAKIHIETRPGNGARSSFRIWRNVMGALRQQEISAASLGLDDVAINSSTNSNRIVTSGFDQITIFVKYTRNAGTGVTFQIEASELSDSTFRKVSSSSVNYVVNLPVNYDQVRIASLVATGSPNANDKATVRVRLGNL